ncbi:phosphotransferase [Candidatus Saccharibacteria bacterium]|nr:phosphotransferase [Candidatus Saccharibacteria bacterium]
MTPETIQKSLAFYDITPLKIHPVQTGYRNKSYHIETSDDQNLNLIFYKSEPDILARIKRTDHLAQIAHDQNLPVRHLADPRTLTLRSKSKTTYARLYHYLPGRTIAWEMFSMKHIKLLGQAMSDLHLSLKDTRTIDLPLATDELITQLAYMQKYFTDPGVTSAISIKLHLQVLLKIFPTLQKTLIETTKLPAQPIHLDLVRGNVLFMNISSASTRDTQFATSYYAGRRVFSDETRDDELEEWRRDECSAEASNWSIGNIQLTGLIDFEKSALGPPILDLARTYAFLLADCAHKTEQQIHKYLIHSGYNKRGRSQIHPNPKLFTQLVNYFLIHDFYKFLAHNPYESLARNHHFLRTRDLLLARKVITTK